MVLELHALPEQAGYAADVNVIDLNLSTFTVTFPTIVEGANDRCAEISAVPHPAPVAVTVSPIIWINGLDVL